MKVFLDESVFGIWMKVYLTDESYCQDAVVRIVLVFSKPGKRRYGSQNPWID